MEVHLPVNEFLDNQSKKISKMYIGDRIVEATRKESDIMNEKILDHEYQLKEIKNILGNLAKVQEDTSTKMSVLVQGISKIDTLIEKISNIDSRYNESINRLHKRIDEDAEKIKELEKTSQEYQLVKKDVKELVDMKAKLITGILSAIGLGIWQLLTK